MITFEAEITDACSNFSLREGAIATSMTNQRPAAPFLANCAFRDRVTVRHLRDLSEVPRQDWDRLFPSKVESWTYFRSCECAAPAGFTTSALVAYADDIAVGAVPLFRTAYRLDMNLPERLRPIAGVIGRLAPSLTEMPLLSMGSPLTEDCPVGFHPDLDPAQQAIAFAALLEGMHTHAILSGVSMLALKDDTGDESSVIEDAMTQSGFARVPTLPIAMLHLPYSHVDEYLATLSTNMRRDLRRKMKHGGKVVVEICHSIDGIEDEIVQLFEETKSKRKVDYDGFDDVPHEYFRSVIAGLGDKALIVLCRVDGVLAGFSLSLIEADRVIGKYVGMRYPLAREHDIYFINWMAVVQYCIAHGIPWLQAGQTTYNQKLRLGCRLRRSWIYFKHRGLLMGPIVRAVGSRLRFDEMDPELKPDPAKPVRELPYLEPGEYARKPQGS